MENLLTVDQVAELFHVHKETVRIWLRDGRLPGRHVGRRWYVLEDDVREALKGGDERGSEKGVASSSVGGSSATVGRSLSASASRAVVPRIIG